jgi:hypothetical protein
MPEITEYYSGGGSTLKPHDIDDELTATIESWRSKTWDDGNKSLYLKLEGVEQEFRCNVSNMKRIAEMYGTSIDGWVGKPISLLPDKTKNPQGAMIDTIIVRVRKTARNAPKAAVKHDDRNPPPHTDKDLDDSIPF